MDNYIAFDRNLSELNKYYLIGIMSAGIIHELNNPVSLILANIQMLEDYIRDNEDAVEIMDIITRNAKRVNIMASQLREYALSSGPSLSENKSEAGKVIDQILDIMRNKLKYRITVKYDMKNHSRPVRYSTAQLSQILMNIISNAAEAIGESGVIEITVINEERYLIIKISDTGCGIPETIKLFEPFQTTKLSSGHAGIGLYVAKRIIEMNGGMISCSTELNHGTEFTISLPSA